MKVSKSNFMGGFQNGQNVQNGADSGAFSAVRDQGLFKELDGGHHRLRSHRVAIGARTLGFPSLLDPVPAR